MKVQKTVKRAEVGVAHEALRRELLERLWREQWRDYIDVPSRTTIEAIGEDEVRITIESCIESGTE